MLVALMVCYDFLCFLKLLSYMSSLPNYSPNWETLEQNFSGVEFLFHRLARGPLRKLRKAQKKTLREPWMSC